MTRAERHKLPARTHTATDDILCPWCEESINGLLSFGLHEGDTEPLECTSCGGSFELSVTVTAWHFTATPLAAFECWPPEGE